MLARWIEGTILLSALLIVVTNPDGFSKATEAVGNLYIGATKTLQGR